MGFDLSSFILWILFGKDGLDGFYRPEEGKSESKHYVFESVFPSQEIMDIALKSQNRAQ